MFININILSIPFLRLIFYIYIIAMMTNVVANSDTLLRNRTMLLAATLIIIAIAWIKT